MSGTKFDQEKVRMDLLPVGMLTEVAKVLGKGGEKYGDHNWKKGMDFSRLYGASLRHIFAWYNGENNDPEFGTHHLAHAICCLTFLYEYQNTLYKFESDDRPTTFSNLFDHMDDKVPEFLQETRPMKDVLSEFLRESTPEELELIDKNKSDIDFSKTRDGGEIDPCAFCDKHCGYEHCAMEIK
jgi:hypothetical protein